MSNKIVQLKDKTFTDNIYPIAGGMAADSVTTQMLKDGSVTSDKVDWTTIQNIDISSYVTVAGTINRAYITIFGKIGFVDITFSPTNNVNGTIAELPGSLDIVPLYVTELSAGVGDGDIRRAVISVSNNKTVISVNQHTGSAGKFIRVFGMFFLQ